MSSGHESGMALCGVIGTVPLAVDRIFGESAAQTSTLVVKDRNSYVECAEIGARHPGAHRKPSFSLRLAEKRGLIQTVAFWEKIE